MYLANAEAPTPPITIGLVNVTEARDSTSSASVPTIDPFVLISPKLIDFAAPNAPVLTVIGADPPPIAPTVTEPTCPDTMTFAVRPLLISPITRVAALAPVELLTIALLAIVAPSISANVTVLFASAKSKEPVARFTSLALMVREVRAAALVPRILVHVAGSTSVVRASVPAKEPTARPVIAVLSRFTVVRPLRPARAVPMFVVAALNSISFR